MDDQTDSSNALPTHRGRRILLTALAVLILGAAGAFLALRSRTTPGTTSNTTTSTAAVNVPPIAPPTVRTRDSDGDRLTDEEEAERNTNPSAADSDADGLGDYEELRVWSSDPLRADTDGDGALDGNEVRSGTSPVGPNLLRDPDAIPNASND